MADTPCCDISAEEIVSQFIDRGILHLAEDGTVWRLKCKVGGDRGPRLASVAPRRADRLLPNNRRQVQVYVDGVRITCSVARLVWYRRHGLIPERHHIHHKDGDRANDRIENLECVEGSAHIAHHNRDPNKKVWNRGLTAHDSDKLRSWHAKCVESRKRNKARKEASDGAD